MVSSCSIEARNAKALPRSSLAAASDRPTALDSEASVWPTTGTGSTILTANARCGGRGASHRRNCVALTGAGVSTARASPPFAATTYRERHDPADFHRRRLDADPAGYWADRLSHREAIYGDIDPEPNAAHEALAALEADGHLDAVLTQNIDGLHDAAGTDRVVELHGTHRRVVCDDCGHRRDAEVVFEQAADSSDLPTP